MPRSSRISRKHPAASAKDPRVYRRLAAWARCHGYRRVNRHVIQQWVVEKLLPHTVPIYEGWGPPRIAQLTEAGSQLLRLCYYRYDESLGRHDIVGANLWLEGFAVPADRIREAIRWALAQLAIESERKAVKAGS